MGGMLPSKADHAVIIQHAQLCAHNLPTSFRCCITTPTARNSHQLPSNIALQYCPSILPSNIARQYCPPILPSNIARQYCPSILPSNIALQYCPPILPSNIARQYCPPTLPSYIALQYCPPTCASIQLPRSNRPDCQAESEVWPGGEASSRPAMAARGSSFSPAEQGVQQQGA